jgi:hypothetical protein
MGGSVLLRRLTTVAALGLALRAWAAGEPVSGVAVEFEDPQQARVSARVSFPINEAIEKAVNQGVPLVLFTEVELQRERPWIWDVELGRAERRSELRYHALSGRYLLQSDGQERIENFPTLEQALRRYGDLNGVPLELSESRGAALEFLRVAVRGRIEAQDLPLLVRLLPVGPAAWQHDTGWLYFPVKIAP